jgi:hypothetical protein
MILHRLHLTNFRGVEDREITFPDHGVVVVHGPNEIGKSSMLEALDLLLTYRDRSNHRDVKQVKPAHSDVGARVEAEISTGPYRFVYRKRFHKKHGTELDIVEPKREHLTGDEAHERVAAMMEQTLDMKLWDAQRVLQSASTSAVNLSGCDALSRALDAAAGEVDAPSGGGPDAGSLLVDRIDAEYQRYFTGTGRPSKDWKAAVDRLAAAKAEVNRCEAAVDVVNERVQRHEELTAVVRGLDEALAPAAQRLAAAQEAQSVVAELADQLGQARLVATAAAATSSNSALANGQRQQLIADAQRRAATLAQAQSELAAAEGGDAEARQESDAAAKTAELAAAAFAAAQERLDAARLTADACVARDDADRLAAKVTKIEDAERNLAELDAALAAITLTDAVLLRIEKNFALVERLQAQLHADAGTVEFTAPADLAITVDGVPRALAAGQGWTQSASAAVIVDVPGVLSVRIDPGASAVTLAAELQAAQGLLDDALAQGGATSVAAARELATRRRTLTDTRGQHAATREAQCDGEDVQAIRARLAERRLAASGAAVDAEVAATELAAAARALSIARADAETARQAAAAAATAAAEKTTHATLLRDRLRAAEAEFATVRDQLVTLRAAVADEVVAAQASADAEAQEQADEVVEGLAARYADAGPDAVAAELTAAAAAAEVIVRDRDAANSALNTITVELGVMGNEGRQGQLDDAKAELCRAQVEHSRIEERANAVKLLRDTMIRHRDNTRQRYVQPYRAELERLGRTVFGPTFEVDVDTDLTICTRTLEGCTVPFDSLSGGAREQLGILARLAGAALVSREDTVPVVIDDALGFSDPERLDKMGAVFNTVGDRGQVIVLTCQPSRYQGIAGAEVIELSA